VGVPTVIAAAWLVSAGLIAASGGHNRATAAGELKCAKGQTPAVIAGRARCLAVGQRCKNADDRLYHRYRFHCVNGRLARRHPIPLQHPLGVRLVNGQGEFFDRKSGARFVPRGATYLRRGTVVVPGDASVFFGKTFVVGAYDSARAEAALTQMESYGFNTVKIFIDGICKSGCLGDRLGFGELSAAYVQNLVDFLKRAKAHHLYVVLTNDGVPANTSYQDAVRAASPTFAGSNAGFLSPAGVNGSAQFWRAFVGTLKDRGAPLDAIAAYEIASEAWYQVHVAPFSLNAGTVTPANGKTYDLTSYDDLVRMMDDGFVYFADTVRAAIKSVDPTALVSMGFFAPVSGQDRYLVTTGVLGRSSLDFVDFHHYPGVPPSFQEAMQLFGLPPQTAKPVVMGEYGAFKFAYPTAESGAAALTDWEHKSCAYGYDGWLMWTWDTEEGAEGEAPLWNAMSQGGTIAQALSPKTRPDPCA